MRVVIPVVINQILRSGTKRFIDRVKECDCDEVIIAVIPNESFDACIEKFKQIKEVSKEFNDAGIKTGVWVCPTLDLVPFKKHTNLTALKEGEIPHKICPLDDEYCKDVSYLMELIAKYTETKKIIMEDDFRMQFPYLSATCFCEHHMKFYSEYIGKTVTKEDFEKNLFDEVNIYREAWVKGLQAGLVKLAKAIRKGVDRVDENIEIVFSTGPANCGSDGTDMFEIIEILKGKHENQTIRLSGAPFWQDGYNLTWSFMTAVNLERYLSKLCKEKGIISRAEGDTCPRPRFAVPASHLEFLHTALLFDGQTDEILKYVFEYTGSPNYEKGYTDTHIRSKEKHKKIKELAKDRKTTGFYPYEDFALARYSDRLNPTPEMDVFESCVREFCVENSLPVSYESGGVNILFGDRARSFDLSLLKNGSIIDIVCAKNLMKMGIDVGIDTIDDRIFKGGEEYFPKENEHVNIAKSFDTSFITLKDGAKPLSYFIDNTAEVLYHSVKEGKKCSADEEIISCFTYENSFGLKFIVLNFDASMCCTRNSAQGIFNNYCRQKLIEENYEWLSGKKIDAFCAGHPRLYIMTKNDENSCVVGLWNFFADEIDMPVVNLGDTYKSAEFIYCDGKLENDKAIITSGLGAFKYCFIKLDK